MIREFYRRPIFFICALSLQLSATKKDNSNVIICISEDHAFHLFDSLDQFGSTINPTPNLSRIAQSGYFHQHAYCSNASSGNTAFPILTGLARNSKLENFAPSEFIGNYFQSIGYETAFFGSWTWPENPEKFGFKDWKVLSDSEIFYNPKIKGPEINRIVEGHSTDIITDLAIRWVLEERSQNKPFFVIVSYQSTRRPWIPPVRMIDSYNNEWFEVPLNFFSTFDERAPANKYQTMNISRDLSLSEDLFLETSTITDEAPLPLSILAKNLASMNDEQKSAWILSWKPQNEAFARESLSKDSLMNWKFQRFFKNYLRCILALDENIGRMVDFLSKNNEETFQFIYTAEKGRFTGEFGWFGSEWMYEPSTKIPLILWSNNSDNYTGIDQERLFLDRDLYGLLKNIHLLHYLKKNGAPKESKELSKLDDVLYFTHQDYPGGYNVASHHGIRKGRYKLIHYYPFNEWEFYDLESDKGEEENLYYKDSHKSEITRLKELLSISASHSKINEHRSKFTESSRREQRSPERKTR